MTAQKIIHIKIEITYPEELPEADRRRWCAEFLRDAADEVFEGPFGAINNLEASGVYPANEDEEWCDQCGRFHLAKASDGEEFHIWPVGEYDR